MQIRNKKARSILIFVVTIQIALCITVILNIPIARQIIGFLYLTFIPGLTVLWLIRLRNLDSWEIILFSVGLSVAFLMFIGFLINELVPLFNISEPLSLVPLMIAVSSLLLISCFLASFVNEGFSIGKPKLHFSYIPFILLPFLSVIGALLVNAYQNNMILLLMILSIAILVIISAFSYKLVPRETYPFALLTISLALLFHASLISNYIWGHDIIREYYLFKTTRNDLRWNSLFSWYPLEGDTVSFDMENAMMSITLLPVIYSIILNLEETWVLKIIYPLIFSFVPLGLYQLYQKKVGKKAAFLSGFFFIAFETFFTEMVGLCRQMIAELFYISLFFTLLSGKLERREKSICFIIFSAGLILSHYSISYIFVIFILFMWLSIKLLEKIGEITPKLRMININLIVVCLVMLSAWYIYISKSGPFNQAVQVWDRTYRSASTEFLNPESRGETVLRGLGLEKPTSLLKLIGRAFAYVTQSFIVIGFISIMWVKGKKKIPNDELKVLVSLNMAILALCIILPNFANSLNMTRFYHILLFFLAPLCIVGGKSISNLISKSKTTSLLLILVVLIPFFLFQTEFIYEIANDESWSVPLSSYRMDAVQYTSAGLQDEQDVFSARWLSEKMDSSITFIYGDTGSVRPLMDYFDAAAHNATIRYLSNITKIEDGDIIYLMRINVVDQVVRARSFVWNITIFHSTLSDMDKIYSNGGSEIYGKHL